MGCCVDHFTMSKISSRSKQKNKNGNAESVYPTPTWAKYWV